MGTGKKWGFLLIAKEKSGNSQGILIRALGMNSVGKCWLESGEQNPRMHTGLATSRLCSKKLYTATARFFIRNHFISNLVLNNVKFRRLLELQGKS